MVPAQDTHCFSCFLPSLTSVFPLHHEVASVSQEAPLTMSLQKSQRLRECQILRLILDLQGHKLSGLQHAGDITVQLCTGANKSEPGPAFLIFIVLLFLVLCSSELSLLLYYKVSILMSFWNYAIIFLAHIYLISPSSWLLNILNMYSLFFCPLSTTNCQLPERRHSLGLSPLCAHSSNMD